MYSAISVAGDQIAGLLRAAVFPWLFHATCSSPRISTHTNTHPNMSSSFTALVTGATSGIGRELAKNLARQGGKVLAIGRRAELLSTLQSEYPDAIIPVSADVSTDAGRAAIAEAVAAGSTQLDFLVHNAAVLGPVGPALIDVSADEVQKAININTVAPVVLSHTLKPHLAPSARVLHISSGAAHRALPGMGLYCVTKAGLYMAWAALNADAAAYTEAGAPRVLYGSAQPGVVDTGMQHSLRTAEGFALHDVFAGYHEEAQKSGSVSAEGATPPPSKALDRPENVAAFLSWLLRETSDDEFIDKEWDIRDSAHHSRWTDAGGAASSE